MYSRNSAKNPRYNPPPGYAGNTFPRGEDVKHHLPSDEVERQEQAKEVPQRMQPESIEQKSQPKNTERQRPKEHDTLEELLRMLKGRFGSEELIILAVMLLIAQDGIGVEVLILALLLIAG